MNWATREWSYAAILRRYQDRKDDEQVGGRKAGQRVV